MGNRLRRTFHIVAGALLAAFAICAPGTARGEDAQALMKKSDCLICHQPENKVVGPSFREIAGRYGEADAAMLVKKVKQGGSGGWGNVPMPPHPAMSDAEVGTIIGWILSAHAPGAKSAKAPDIVPGTKPGQEQPAYRAFPVVGSRVAIWVVAQLHLM